MKGSSSSSSSSSSSLTALAVCLCFSLCIAGAMGQSQPKIPVLPQSFSTNFDFGINWVMEGAPFISGFFAVDYPKGAGRIHFRDAASSKVPYELQTTIIGVPSGPGVSDGFQTLDIGRCWKLGSLGSDYFHFIPLSIPNSASFTGNSTNAAGELIGHWSWTSDLEFIPFHNKMAVRYSDNGIMSYSFSENFLFPFVATFTNTEFKVGADKQNFMVPPGPCADHSWDVVEKRSIPETLSTMEFIKFVTKPFSTAMLWQDLYETMTAPSKGVVVSDNADPSPPKLHQYFSAGFEMGYGTLNADDHFNPPNSIFTGFTAVDKVAGGLYFTIFDDQAANVPMQFSTTLISAPFPGNPSNITGFMTLNTNRCWTYADAFNPSWPLKVPEDATYEGTHTALGSTFTLWSFQGGAFDSTFSMAIDTKTNNIVFVNGYAAYNLFISGNAYLIFNRFDQSKPSANTFLAPVGNCVNPL